MREFKVAFRQKSNSKEESEKIINEAFNVIFREIARQTRLRRSIDKRKYRKGVTLDG